MEKPAKLKNNNIGWIDFLRVIACFLVVISHSCDPFIAQFDADRGTFLTGAFMGSLMRSCVPLFVMMTGVLLLPVRNMGMGQFYKKRIGRIIIPLVFWSVVLPVLFFVYLNYVKPGTTNLMVNVADYTTGNMLSKIYLFIFNFNFDTIPLWYLYMLIGLYLVMPILSAWLNQASKKDIKLFLYLWGVSLLVPYLTMLAPALGYAGNYGSMGIFGVCGWNDYGTFYYFSGFIGYLVLAYYLVKYPPSWSLKRTLAICIPLFIAGYGATIGGYLLIQEYFPGDYTYLEIPWLFCGINVFMMTFAVFSIVQKLKIPSSATMSHLASLSFGIYLCHFVFVQLAYDVFDIHSLPTIVKILLTAILSYLISAAVSKLLWSFKITRKFIA